MFVIGSLPERRAARYERVQKILLPVRMYKYSARGVGERATNCLPTCLPARR